MLLCRDDSNYKCEGIRESTTQETKREAGNETQIRVPGFDINW